VDGQSGNLVCHGCDRLRQISMSFNINEKMEFLKRSPSECCSALKCAHQTTTAANWWRNRCGSEWSDCFETIEPYGDSNLLYGGTKVKTNMNDDLDDIPMAYFWYPFLAIVTMVGAAVAVVIKMV
jgi:hypothetical protein